MILQSDLPGTNIKELDKYNFSRSGGTRGPAPEALPPNDLVLRLLQNVANYSLAPFTCYICMQDQVATEVEARSWSGAARSVSAATCMHFVCCLILQVGNIAFTK